MRNIHTIRENEINTSVLKDSFGRTINNLRISVTDQCNFRCRYCMPEKGMVWMKKDEMLSYEEIQRIVRIFAELGIKKVRLTGGEPLMRKELHLLVAMVSDIREIDDLALTTNGYFLADHIEKLVNAGLSRINISLDSLDPINFKSITRRNYYEKVWEGIRAAEKFSIGPVKINVVLIRGINDNEILDFAKLARRGKLIIRFIEFMPIGAADGWSVDKVIPSQEIKEIIEKGLRTRLLPKEGIIGQPAERFIFEDGIGEIGFIGSVSEPFCNLCNRVRITSDGKLRTCLFSLKETDLKKLIRDKAEDEDIKQTILEAVWNKEAGHQINHRSFVRPKRTMSQIGG